MHRVVPPPGAQSEVSRLSIAYALKPPYKCRMERLKGDGIPQGDEEEVGTYEEFHAKKSKGYREGKNLVDSRGKKAEKSVDVSASEVVA